MKIAIIADAVDRNNAGISQYVRQLIMQLKQRHELTVIHLRKSVDPVYAGVKEIIIPKFFHRPGLSRGYINFFLHSLDVDIIHHPSTIGSYIIPPKQPLVQTVYDVISVKLPRTRTFFNRLVYRVFFKPSVKNAKAIITISEHSKKDICSLLHVNPNKVFVTLLASQHAKPSSAEVKRVLGVYNISYPYFLFVGTLEPRKNIVRMLEAFAQSGLESHHFVLVGSLGWKYDEVFRTISRLNLDHRVHFLTGVPNSDLPGVYALADALVFASLYEGFGLPVLEAMACGCPVISSRTSSLPEVAGDAALYVDPLNVGDIAKAMKVVLKKRSYLVRKGFIQAKKFSWNKTAEQTVRVYEKILGR